MEFGMFVKATALPDAGDHEEYLPFEHVSVQ